MDKNQLEKECGVSDDFETNVIYRRDISGRLFAVKIPDDVEEADANVGDD